MAVLKLKLISILSVVGKTLSNISTGISGCQWIPIYTLYLSSPIAFEMEGPQVAEPRCQIGPRPAKSLVCNAPNIYRISTQPHRNERKIVRGLASRRSIVTFKKARAPGATKRRYCKMKGSVWIHRGPGAHLEPRGPSTMLR